MLPSPTRINLEEPGDYPAQPGLTWRNLVRLPSPTGINLFLRHSVCLSVCLSISLLVRAKKRIQSKRVFMRRNSIFSISVR